jgi:hypothetical protein
LYYTDLGKCCPLSVRPLVSGLKSDCSVWSQPIQVRSVVMVRDFLPVFRGSHADIILPMLHIRFPYLLTYSMEKSPSWNVTDLQVVKKFPTFYGTRKFMTTFTSPRHLSLSWASSIQSIHPHPTSWKFILIWSSHLHLGFPTKALYTSPSPAFELHAPSIPFFSILSPAFVPAGKSSVAWKPSEKQYYFEKKNWQLRETELITHFYSLRTKSKFPHLSRQHTACSD